MQLIGSITALVTPFDSHGRLDLAAFEALVERQIRGGTQGLVVAGSTGEAAALTSDEYRQLLRCAVVAVARRVPLLAGTGLSGTAATVEQTRRARDAGVDAALVVTPPYVRPTSAGLEAHFRQVAREGGLPIVLYNVPGRTGCDLAPEVVAALRDQPEIIGVKEAKADLQRIRDLLSLAGDDFSVLSGDDPSAMASMRLGAAGVISVASNAAPGLMRRLCDCALGLSVPPWTADEQSLMDELFEVCGLESNPIPVKALLAELGQIGDHLRLPLLPLSAHYRARMSALAARLRCLDAAAPTA